MIMAAVVSASVTGAQAEPAPTAQAADLPATVSADILPTPQIDGVVWDQAANDKVVFAGGSFTSTRPFLAPAGKGETPRFNLLSYDIETGELLDFAPELNGQVRVVELSPDSKRLFVGGEFTKVNGVNRYRVAVFDVATGELVNDIVPSLDYHALDLSVTADTLYIGGKFTSASGQRRVNAAAYDLKTGNLLPWDPGVQDGRIHGLEATADGSKVVLVGSFTRVRDRSARAWVGVDGTTGEPMSWPVNEIIENSGSRAALYSVSSDENRVYVTGYRYGGGHLFEGAAAADWDGNLEWIADCRGDSYDVAPMGEVAYYVSHNHDCSSLDGIPDRNPWIYQHANAVTSTQSPDGRVNKSRRFPGTPAPELLSWYPRFKAGRFTGLNQAAWTVETTDKYVLLGGEFPEVNGQKQQGLTRFVIREQAPGKMGPERKPGLELGWVNGAEVSMHVRASYDADDTTLSYALRRNGLVVAKVNQKSHWWDDITVEMVDPEAPTGEHSYVVEVRDSSGHMLRSDAVKVMVENGVDPNLPEPERPDVGGEYTRAVLADNPTDYWRMGEATGDFKNSISSKHLGVADQVTRDLPGATGGDDRSADFRAVGAVGAAEKSKRWAPWQYSTEIWFKSTGLEGGVLMDMAGSNVEPSNYKGRHTYMRPDGRLVAGVYDSKTHVAVSEAPFNDGQWHHVVTTFAPTKGLTLFVDGKQVAHNPEPKSALRMWGFWRVGGDNASGWPNAPEGTAFPGRLDEAAVYDKVLTAEQVAAHWNATRPRDADGNVIPPPEEPEELPQPAPDPKLVDTFDRDESGRWGFTKAGYEWIHATTESSVHVADGAAGATVRPGGLAVSLLEGKYLTDTDVTVPVQCAVPPTGDGAKVVVVARSKNDTNYRVTATVVGEAVQELTLSKVVFGQETVLATATPEGLTCTATGLLTMRLSVVEDRLQATAWNGATAPEGWLVEAEDDTAELARPGIAGVHVSLAGDHEGEPVTVRFPEFTVTGR